MGGASSADSSVQIVLGGGTDKVVVPTRVELESSGLGRERPERYREVHRLEGLVANCNYPGTRIRYPTRLVLLFRNLCANETIQF